MAKSRGGARVRLSASGLLLALVLSVCITSAAATAASSPATAAGDNALLPRLAPELDPRNVRQAWHPAPRSYASHHYYAIELASRAAGTEETAAEERARAQRAADALGAELVERVGELRRHWLVRAPKREAERSIDEGEAAAHALERRWHDYVAHEDPVLRRWAELRSSALGAPSAQGVAKRSAEAEAALAIRDVERQEPRQRAKRDAIYSPWDTPNLYARDGADFELARRAGGAAGADADADAPQLEQRSADRLPWPRHIPAPEGASPDPRDDPDYLAFAPVGYRDAAGGESARRALVPQKRAAERRHYDGGVSSSESRAVLELERRAPPPIPDSPSMRLASEFGIKDPIFPAQWHLANDKRIGYDLNVSGVWKQGIFGRGVTVALIDDGLDMHADDLKENFYAAGSYDFNNHVPLPEPRLSDDQHGTRCAGEIAAVKNDKCGVGVAYHAHVSGLRILSGPISDVDEAAALNYDYQNNAIYSCSWGPPDDGRSMDAPKGLIAKAMLNGINNGRGGKGSIYVFAGGNGGASDDQCNFDGYTNSIYTMTIAAVNREGQHPYYSEMCAATIATSWSSGAGDHIHTTDVTRNGQQRCTSSHGGTSAAAPLVAGVAALALEARPDLTWRDMQHVAVRSAQMINPDDKDWQQTQAGRHFNHKYGYGMIDAYAFVEEAKRHKLVKPQAWLETDKIEIESTRTLIQQGGVENTFKVTKEMLQKNNLETLEHVTVRVWITHERRGDVQVELTSPHGTKSVLARPRRFDESTIGFPGWGFMTLKHWDEDPEGEWKLAVFDRSHPKQTGNFHAWTLSLWGAAIDPAKAKPWEFPPGSKEAHIELPGYPSHPAAPVDAKPSETVQHSKPTDHLPSNHGADAGESHVDFTNGKVTDPTVPLPEKPEADTGYLANLRKNSGTWLFVAAGVVFIFAGSVVAFFVMRRKRTSARAGEYEFVPEDEDMMLGSLPRGTAPTKRARTKELYDAFGDAPSEDEDDDDDDAPGHVARGIYHDDEADEEGDTRFSIGGPGSAITPTSANTAARYRDEPDAGAGGAASSPPQPPASGNDDEKRRAEEDLLFDAGADDDDAGSGESWQDAGKPEKA